MLEPRRGRTKKIYSVRLLPEKLATKKETKCCIYVHGARNFLDVRNKLMHKKDKLRKLNVRVSVSRVRET